MNSVQCVYSVQCEYRVQRVYSLQCKYSVSYESIVQYVYSVQFVYNDSQWLDRDSGDNRMSLWGLLETGGTFTTFLLTSKQTRFLGWSKYFCMFNKKHLFRMLSILKKPINFPSCVSQGKHFLFNRHSVAGAVLQTPSPIRD